MRNRHNKNTSLDHFCDTPSFFIILEKFIFTEEQNSKHSVIYFILQLYGDLYFWPNSSIKQANNINTGWCWTQKGGSCAANGSEDLKWFYCIPGDAEGHCGAVECWARQWRHCWGRWSLGCIFDSDTSVSLTPQLFFHSGIHH